MSEEHEESPLITATFEELAVGEYFDFLSEKYMKTSNIEARNINRKFIWLFPPETEVNQ